MSRTNLSCRKALHASWQLAGLILTVGWVCTVAGAEASSRGLAVNFLEPDAPVRRLHGMNRGPLAEGGTVDLALRLQELGVPVTRLHDCQWPYPDVVDIHAIFRNPSADPGREVSYDFLLTDDYLSAITRLGIGIVYRLGESIEHAERKRYVHPPANPERWADACLGIIRHYNEGWAGGKRYSIRYWEIWNEPENRPAMWTGSDDEYFNLYRVAAERIKRAFPDLKVGGPSLGYYGSFEHEKFVPSDFAAKFLEMCRRDRVPLDFFSWHCYTDDPGEPARRAGAIRKWLDTNGFVKTESHLNEWNYLPANDWSPMGRTAPPERRRQWRQDMAGAAGAAFVVSVLIDLQGAPVDMANFYHVETGLFGLFDNDGVPNRVWEAFRAFNRVAALPVRARTAGGKPGATQIIATRNSDGTEAAVLLGHCDSRRKVFDLDLQHGNFGCRWELWQLDPSRPWHKSGEGSIPAGRGTIPLTLEAPGVALITLSRATE